MMYIIPAAEPVTLSITGSDDFFPVRRIYCIGRNYAEHAREMGHDPDREPPFFFEKHPSCIVSSEGTLNFPYPTMTDDVHHEVELVVALKTGGQNISIEAAQAAIFGYAVGIDFTRRDLQGEAKNKGRPWMTGKSFDHSAPCSALVRAEQVRNLENAKIWLDKNGTRVQSGKINQMIWNCAEAIAYLSTLNTLYAGDIIMTGTPAGVGPVQKGDQLECSIDGVAHLRVNCC